jgi:Uma2 family endonuclease
MELRNETERFTAIERDSWEDGEKWELISGRAYLMAPPLSAHQMVSAELFGQIRELLKGTPCAPFYAPFGVYLNSKRNEQSDQKDNTVVEPDIFVVCDHSKISKRGFEGVPDLIIEILSPSTRRYDMFTKMKLYHEYAVQAYWVVDIEAAYVTVYLLENGKYTAAVFGAHDTIESEVFQGHSVNLADVFDAAVVDE